MKTLNDVSLNEILTINVLDRETIFITNNHIRTTSPWYGGLMKNVYFSHGTTSGQRLYEDLIIVQCPITVLSE